MACKAKPCRPSRPKGIVGDLSRVQVGHGGLAHWLSLKWQLCRSRRRLLTGDDALAPLRQAMSTKSSGRRCSKGPQHQWNAFLAARAFVQKLLSPHKGHHEQDPVCIDRRRFRHHGRPRGRRGCPCPCSCRGEHRRACGIGRPRSQERKQEGAQEGRSGLGSSGSFGRFGSQVRPSAGSTRR